MGTAYDKKDAAAETDSSDDDVSGAWHNARNDASRDDDRYQGRDERKESATRDTNYYTNEKWNPVTREWE